MLIFEGSTLRAISHARYVRIWSMTNPWRSSACFACWSSPSISNGAVYPWDRQESESPKAFYAFKLYKDAGAKVPS